MMKSPAQQHLGKGTVLLKAILCGIIAIAALSFVTFRILSYDHYGDRMSPGDSSFLIFMILITNISAFGALHFKNKWLRM